MRSVLFIMPSLPGGGAEKVLIDILKRLDRNKYRISLFLEYREGEYVKAIPDDIAVNYLFKQSNIWIERFHRGLRLVGLYHLFHSVIYKSILRVIFKRKRFDTIVSFMEGEAVRLHSYLLDKSENNVSWVHIDFQKKHWSADYFRSDAHEESIYTALHRIIFVSSAAFDSFLRLFQKVDASRCRVIFNLIDKDEIVRQSLLNEIKKDRFTICMAGRLNQQKRYDRALRLIKALSDKSIDVELWILGEGELREILISLANELGILDRCRFLGFVKPPYPYMRAADIYLNTSEAEGYPLVLCEALCLGLPIVATDITGAHEILEDSKYGLLVPEKDDLILKGVERLIVDNGFREYYKQKAKERSEYFSVQTVLHMIDSVL